MRVRETVLSLGRSVNAASRVRLGLVVAFRAPHRTDGEVA